ncbi:putative MFS transporter [Podospora australis]|uniref:MFS transporter n=1 Tax=Podospora australis TaxID=1536484 RepID=A0AAN6WUV6_9PEZI|nr:putative MFS transporter [Podospora australis]
MGLGILEDRVMEHVPGTTRYFDDPDRPQYAADGVEGLKCDKSGSVPIILVPQPSDDPNDPLNWPLWKRDLITFILSLTAIFATSLGPILAANTLTLTFDFSIPFTKVAELTGWYLFGVGISAFIFVPMGRIWGKRHLFVGGAVLLMVTALWGGLSRKNYKSMVAARVFQGVATAPFESLVNAAVGDLYHVHQRGIRMAFTNLAVFGGAFFTPIVVGKITKSLGWWWTFYLVAIFSALCIPAIVLWCPETAYRRDNKLNTDMLATGNTTRNHTAGTVVDDNETEEKKVDNKAPSTPDTVDGEASTHNVQNGGALEDARGPPPAYPGLSSYHRLALFSGRKTDENFFKLLARPFVLFFQPAFFWACLIQGLMIGWTVFIGVILAQFFLATPLWWGEVKTGYAYTGAFVGAVAGFIIAGALADWSARLMTKWNGGIYEPEFRLVLVIPMMIIGCAGLYGWGITVDGLFWEEYHYAIPLMFFGFQVAGMVIGAVASSLYIVDAYRDLAVEGFTVMIVFKNLLSFGLTFKAFEWLVTNGSKATPLFNIVGSLQVGVCLLTIPLYVFGKRMRSFFHRHDLLAYCKVR